MRIWIVRYTDRHVEGAFVDEITYRALDAEEAEDLFWVRMDHWYRWKVIEVREQA